MKIYINEKDGHGWAIDMIRKDIKNALSRLNIQETSNPLKADIIHNIWWNNFLKVRYLPLRFKRNIILTAVNFIDLENKNYFLTKEFHKANKFATAWISPSEKQTKILEKYCKKVVTIPYYLDFNLFNFSENINKQTIYKKYNIPENLLKNKVVISSFQRDSLGSDLSKPKWQKGPELLIELLKDLPENKFILLLSGPRRHFVIKQCKKHNIPYYYIGKEMPGDDININGLPFSDMPDLYRISDLYLITSKSEGGPKAVQEATSLKVPIFSTDVGLASDFINKENIFTDTEKYKTAVLNFVNNYLQNQNARQSTVNQQYNKCIEFCSYEVIDKKIKTVYDYLMKN
ncbi:MAG: glycosyltransferase [Bacteroidales bacterium]|nr:glycosyltransferase [Bacteroidales bacterium]